jgi:TolB protein
MRGTHALLAVIALGLTSLSCKNSPTSPSVWPLAFPLFSDPLVYTVTGGATKIVESDGSQTADVPLTCTNPNLSQNHTRLIYSAGVDPDRKIMTSRIDGTDVREITSILSGSSAVFSFDGRFIAFNGFPSSYSDIYTCYANGGKVTNLTNTTTTHRLHPCWNPFGTKIAFSGGVTAGGSNIFAMDRSGGAVTNLSRTPGASESYPEFSPDGKKIVFTRFEGSGQIYVMDSDGSHQVNLTNAASNDVLPKWSPNGSRIAFLSDRETSGIMQIWIMDADGSNSVQLTGVSPPGVMWFDW